MSFLFSKEFRAILINTFSQIVIKLSGSATTFFVTLLISYFMGLDTFGSFIKVTTLVTFLYLIIDFGLNSSIIKDHLEDVERYLGNLLLLRLGISLLLFTFLLGTVFFLPYNVSSGNGFSNAEKIGVIIYSLSLFSYSLKISIQSILQKHLLFRLSLIPTILSSMALLATVVLGISLDNFFILLLAYPIADIILFLFSYAILKKEVSLSLSFSSIKAFSKRMIISSFPLALMIFLNLVYFRVDTIILSFYKPSIEVGVYGLAYKFFEFMIAFPTFFSASLFPILVEKSKDREFSIHFRSYIMFLLMSSLILIPIVYILAPLIGVLKQEFVLSVTPLRILALSLPFFFVTSLLQWVLIIRNKKTLLIILYTISMAINLLLNMLFVPEYGYLAASYITVLSEGIVCLGMIVIFYSARNEIFTK